MGSRGLLASDADALSGAYSAHFPPLLRCPCMPAALLQRSSRGILGFPKSSAFHAQVRGDFISFKPVDCSEYDDLAALLQIE